MNLELKDKVAVVTGGSRGIGKAIARALAREGVDVALIARDIATADVSATEIAEETGRRLRAYSADTGDDKAVHGAFVQIARDFGRIDILVNAAAQPGGQAAPPKLMVLTSVAVKAGTAPVYERWLKTELLPGLKKGGQKMYLVSSTLFGGTLLTYHSVTFANSFADLDKPSALIAGLGQEGADKVMSHSTMVEHVERNVYRIMPELSIFGAPGTN